MSDAEISDRLLADYQRYLKQTEAPVAAAILAVGERLLGQAEGISQSLTVEQAAKRLKIGRATMYRLIDSGTLPHQRIGRAIRIRPDDLDSLAQPGVKPPPPGQVTLAMLDQQIAERRARRRDQEKRDREGKSPRQR